MAGVLCGLLGVAGGVVIVPVLTSRRIGMARATASGTTIAAVLPISAVAALTYAGLHNVDEPAASAIVPGAAAGVIIGSLLATRVRASVLRILFQIVLLATAVRLLVALPSGSIYQIALEAPAAVTLCAMGTVAGLASGMLGSGGGSFLVPALVVGFGLVQQVAQGTALLALIPIWIIGALTHHKTHTLGLREAVALGSCGALTVPLGAEIASHVGALPLRAVFAAFLIATAGWGLARTGNRGNQPAPQTDPAPASLAEPFSAETPPPIRGETRLPAAGITYRWQLVVAGRVNCCGIRVGPDAGLVSGCGLAGLCRRAERPGGPLLEVVVDDQV